MMKRLLTSLLFLAVAAGAFGAYIDSSRVITWDPGVAGGIPDTTSWTVINVKNSPYNATGNGSTNDTTAIQNAINAAGANTIVLFPAGTYAVTSTLSVVNKETIVLRGADPETAVIKYTGSGGNHIIDCGRTKTVGSNLTITGSPAKGTSTITLSSVSGLAVGDYCVISTANMSGVDPKNGNWLGNDDSTRVQTQMNRITAISGSNVTLYHPLYWTLDSTGRLNEVTLQSKIGIENLGIWRSNSASQDGANIWFRYVVDSWVSNVHSRFSGRRHIEIRNSFRCTVQGSYMDDSNSVISDHGYHLYCWGWNSDHLFVNNICRKARHAFAFEGGGSGVVFAYNYSVDADTSPDHDWLTEDLDTHGAHPFQNLFEGNVCSHFVFDYTWGSSSDNLVFRSQAMMYSGSQVSPFSFRVGADVEQKNYRMNFVGNYFGRIGDSASGKTTWRFGYSSPGGSSTDSQSLATVYRHGNYSIVEATTSWDAGNADHTIPSSAYLSVKPTWWDTYSAGSNTPPPWPSIGPDLSPMVTKIPAQLRYEGAPLVTGGGSVPTAPSSLSATTFSSSRIDLNWTDNANDETGYKVEQSAAGAGSWSQIATPAADATSYSVTSGLSAGTAYDFRVRCANGNGNSSYSNTASATTTGGGSPVISVTPGSTVDLGIKATGTTTDQVFAVTNTGTGTLSGTASASTPLSITAGSSYSLGASASQNTTARWSPTAGAALSQAVTFTGGGGASVTLTGIGVVVQPALTFNADVGTLLSGATDGGAYITSSSSVTAPSDAPRALYMFTIVDAGEYRLQTIANAPDSGSNSMWLDIDTPPIDATTIWDVPVTSGSFTTFPNVSWRGANQTGTPQFPAKTWSLSAGVHYLDIRIREGGLQLQSFQLVNTSTGVAVTISGALTVDSISIQSP